jgi:hypothetical protein
VVDAMLTDPSCNPLTPPRPRVPTTSRSASDDISTGTRAGRPSTTAVLMWTAGWPLRTRSADPRSTGSARRCPSAFTSGWRAGPRRRRQAPTCRRCGWCRRSSPPDGRPSSRQDQSASIRARPRSRTTRASFVVGYVPDAGPPSHSTEPRLAPAQASRTPGTIDPARFSAACQGVPARASVSESTAHVE